MKEFLRDFGSTIISTAAFIVSVLGYRIARRTDRRSVEGTKPLITANVSPVKDQPRWFHVYWSVENRSNHGQRATSITIKRPPFCYGLSHADAHSASKDSKPYDPKKELKNPLPVKLARRKIELNFKLERAGVVRHGPFPGAAHSGSIYVRVPWWVFSRRFSMAVTLVSMEAEERESVFAVRRNIPAVSKDKTNGII
jgi:hypothetical protein